MIYILLLYLIGIVLFMSNKIRITNRHIYGGILILTLSLVFAIRPFSVFTDTNAYRDVFEAIKLNDNIGFSLIRSYSKLDVEYGFYYLSWAIKHITKDFRVYFFIIALLQVLFFSLYIHEKYDDPRKRQMVSAYTYPFFGLLYMGITFRAGLEIVMMLYALELIKNNKKKMLAIVIMVLAFSIHRMAIIFIFLWAIYKFVPKLKVSTYRAIWIMSGLLLLIHSVTLSELIMFLFTKLVSKTVFYKMYYGYIDAGMYKSLWTTKLPVRYLFFWFIGTIVILELKNQLYLKKNYRYLNIYIFGVMLLALFFFFPGGSRVIDYFLLPIILLYTELMDKDIKTTYRSRILKYSYSIVYIIMGITLVVRLSA